MRAAARCELAAVSATSNAETRSERLTLGITLEAAMITLLQFVADYYAYALAGLAVYWLCGLAIASANYPDQFQGRARADRDQEPRQTRPAFADADRPGAPQPIGRTEEATVLIAMLGQKLGRPPLLKEVQNAYPDLPKTTAHRALKRVS